MKKKAIVFDIDNTLANNSHRVHLIEGEKKDWDAFNSACMTDKIIPQMKSVLTGLRYQNRLCTFIVCTGRPNKYRTMTEAWLKMNDIPYDEIYMRSSGDYRKDFEAKADLMDEILNEYDVLMTFEDRKSVCQEWENRGVFTFKVQSYDD